MVGALAGVPPACTLDRACARFADARCAPITDKVRRRGFARVSRPPAPSFATRNEHSATPLGRWAAASRRNPPSAGDWPVSAPAATLGPSIRCEASTRHKISGWRRWRGQGRRPPSRRQSPRAARNGFTEIDACADDADPPPRRRLHRGTADELSGLSHGEDAPSRPLRSRHDGPGSDEDLAERIRLQPFPNARGPRPDSAIRSTAARCPGPT